MNKIGRNLFKVTGIMSGTSLDGADFAACTFAFNHGRWEYTIEHAITFAYSMEWKNRLKTLLNSSADDFAKVHYDYGRLTGKMAKRFHLETGFDPLFIATHGHTIFHNPAGGYTIQAGSGAAVAIAAEKPVICDFRANDVCLGGQGAPLVPIGDKLLFSKYDACLNLGGFSNISFEKENSRFAFDICPVNTVLNFLSNKMNLDYDQEGNLARQGKVLKTLLDQLNALTYFKTSPPKSLSVEWLNRHVLPLLQPQDRTVPDLLRTLVEHIAIQISDVLRTYKIKNTLITGGGVHNRFLIERLKTLSLCKLVVPENKLVDYKEALVFAFLGLLRWIEQPNCLASATGASGNAVGGAVYLPSK